MITAERELISANRKAKLRSLCCAFSGSSGSWPKCLLTSRVSAVRDATSWIWCIQGFHTSHCTRIPAIHIVGHHGRLFRGAHRSCLQIQFRPGDEDQRSSQYVTPLADTIFAQDVLILRQEPFKMASQSSSKIYPASSSRSRKPAS
jgi:hypothetical protein